MLFRENSGKLGKLFGLQGGQESLAVLVELALRPCRLVSAQVPLRFGGACCSKAEQSGLMCNTLPVVAPKASCLWRLLLATSVRIRPMRSDGSAMSVVGGGAPASALCSDSMLVRDVCLSRRQC